MEWLRADLVFWERHADRETGRRALTSWSGDWDFEVLHLPYFQKPLSDEAREECAAFWRDVIEMLDRMGD